MKIAMETGATTKFKALVHYVCATADGNQLGATKLNKILWLSDMLWYLNEGRSLSDESYVKRQFGPVPAHILSALDELRAEGKLRTQNEHQFGYTFRRFISLEDPSTESFSAEEISFVDQVIRLVCEQHTAKSISEASHDRAWEIAKIGETIPYEAIYISGEGELSGQDMEWAKATLDARAA